MYRRLLSLGVILFVVVATAGSIPAPVAAQDTGSISGTLVDDADADGEIDAGEKGLAGWRVLLEGEIGDEGAGVRHETRTDACGEYRFAHLEPGWYVVSVPCEDQPRPHVITGENEELGIELESGGSLQQNGMDIFLSSVDSPSAGNGTISGKVVWDQNRDGIADPSEAGVSGWQVDARLHGSQCVAPEKQERFGRTAEDGSFRLSGLVPGGYSVTVSSPERLGNYVVDAPAVEQPGLERSILELLNEVIVADGESQTITIGVLSLEGGASISGVVYFDLNLNGIRDPNEPVKMTYGFIGLLYRTAKGYTLVSLSPAFDRGRYEFAGLAAGDYVVGVLDLMGQAVNPAAGPDGVPEASVTLGEGEQRTGVDFGSSEQPPEQPATETPQPTPMITAIPGTTPSAVGTSTQPVSAPFTGTGGAATGGGRVPLLALALAASTVGAVGMTCAIGRRARPS